MFDLPFETAIAEKTWLAKDQLYLQISASQNTSGYPLQQEIYCFSFTDQTLALILSVSHARNFPVYAIQPMGDRTLLVASQDQEGTELWVSDGTSAGTRMLDQFWPGLSNGIQPLNNPLLSSSLTVSAGVAYFPVASPGRGTELGRSDGTLEGAYLVSEDILGFDSGSPHQLIPWQDGLLYLGRDRVSGTEWRFLSPDAPPISTPAGSFDEDFTWMELIQAELFNNQNRLFLQDMQANGKGDVLLSALTSQAAPVVYYQNERLEWLDTISNAWKPQSWLSRFDSTGDLRWVKRLPPIREQFVNQMALGEDGSTYLAITTAHAAEVKVDELPAFASPNGLLLRLDAQGKAQWGKGIRVGHGLRFYKVLSHSTGIWILGES